MIHFFLLPLLLVAKPADISATPTVRPTPAIGSCCLPRVWSASYLWRESNFSGRVVVDYTEEVFANRENPNGKTKWQMQSRGGRYLHYSSINVQKNDVVFSSPVSSALELNRCLHGGRLVQQQNGKRALYFELTDTTNVRGRSHCQDAVNKRTTIRLWVDPRTCYPQKLQYSTHIQSSQLNYVLPLPVFHLSGVQAHNSGLAGSVELFLAEQRRLYTTGRREQCPVNGNSLFSPIYRALQEANRRLYLRGRT